jgi:hypothetical protein
MPWPDKPPEPIDFKVARYPILLELTLILAVTDGGIMLCVQ